MLASNNAYALGLPGRGRPALDGGQLGVIVIDAPATGPGSPSTDWTAPSLDVSGPSLRSGRAPRR